jgi:hypothetical protein
MNPSQAFSLIWTPVAVSCVVVTVIVYIWLVVVFGIAPIAQLLLLLLVVVVWRKSEKESCQRVSQV